METSSRFAISFSLKAIRVVISRTRRDSDTHFHAVFKTAGHPPPWNRGGGICFRARDFFLPILVWGFARLRLFLLFEMYLQVKHFDTGGSAFVGIFPQNSRLAAGMHGVAITAYTPRFLVRPSPYLRGANVLVGSYIGVDALILFLL